MMNILSFTFSTFIACQHVLNFDVVTAFHVSNGAARSPPRRVPLQLSAHKLLLKERTTRDVDTLTGTFDPLELAGTFSDYARVEKSSRSTAAPSTRSSSNAAAVMAGVTSVALVTATEEKAAYGITFDGLKGGLTVETFQPVCGTSDGFYRVLQQAVASTVGPENFAEYGPLIASGLLRVRLELCVVESFFNEAVGPFIKDNGLSWILPLHETVETFIAGCVFAIATTFILIGSTKLVTVIITYADFLIGLPARLFGGFAFDRAQGKPVTLDVGFGPFKTRVIGPPKESESTEGTGLKNLSAVSIVVLILSGAVNYLGQAMRILRELLEAIDAFVGRYLAIWASAYLIIKFVHFKIFPDFP